jgi:hypothetical protein
VKEPQSSTASQLKEVVISAERHDLKGTEIRAQTLSEQLKLSPDDVLALKRAKLRQLLDSGIRHLQRAAPISALVRFREALSGWLS